MTDPATEHIAPYNALAVGYDVVMEHVRYDAWAAHIHRLLSEHHPRPVSILELGCGTASLALHLQSMGDYAYLATDRSAAMVRVARRKVTLEQLPIQVAEADFTHFEIAEPVDVVLLLYDGLNYLLEPRQIEKMFSCVSAALRSDGLFIFDQSTPVNSLQNEQDFQDEGSYRGFSYLRESSYDPETHLHTTTFEIEAKGRRFREEHVQRAYTLDEIAALIEDVPLSVEAVYDGFSREPAHKKSERVHWVLRR